MKFVYGGLFDTSDEWIHPSRAENTWEIIYNMDSDIYIEEGESRITLKKGSLLILKPGVMHRGFKPSFGHTAFYWVHFNEFDEKLPRYSESFTEAYLFRELLHFSRIPDCDSGITDAVLNHIFALLTYSKRSVSKLSADVFEWCRINASAHLTAEKTAKHFGYNAEHLSRMIRKSYGVGLKALIDSFIISKAKDILSNTELSVKETAALLEFSDDNAFINFYKYHEEKSPARFRNTYTATHMNNK